MNTFAMERQSQMRILAISALWQGANDYAFVRAFRRLGHSVQVVSEQDFFPRWRSKSLRAVRRTLTGLIIKEFNKSLLDRASSFCPDLLFVFKGRYVDPSSLKAIKSRGTACIQFHPDVTVFGDGPILPKALPQYDWIFTTKTFGLDDLSRDLGINHASFLPHGYDPETHRIWEVNETDVRQYSCDISFIGNRSKKKEKTLYDIITQRPNLDIRIWGSEEWRGAAAPVAARYRGYPVLGMQYAKAILLSKINLGLLMERWGGATSGDRITARTFEVPASGGFMLHESTHELGTYFVEGRECDCFSSRDEMFRKIDYYMIDDDRRRSIAAAGHTRCLNSGYSTEHLAEAVLAKAREISATRTQSF